MENTNMLSKIVQFQTSTIVDTLEFFSTMQHNGEELLKTTLRQSPWLDKSSKEACIFWADACTQNLQKVTVLVDQGFTEIERFSSMSLELGKKQPQITAAPGQNTTPSKAKQDSPRRKKNG